MASFELTPEEIKLFLDESKEQLQLMEACLISLEENPNQPELIQDIFRAAHTLKGGAATAGFHNAAELTHAMETSLDSVRQGRSSISSEWADRLLTGVDVLRKCLTAIEEQGTAEGVDVSQVVDLFRDDPVQPAADEVWQMVVELSPDAAMPAVRAYQVLLTIEDHARVVKTDPSREEIEQEAGKVHRLVITLGDPNRLEELFKGLKTALTDIPDVISVEKLEPSTRATPSAQAAFTSGAPGGELGQTIRVNVQILDTLMNLVGELVIDRTRLAQLATVDMDRQSLQEEISQLSGRLSRMTTDLQENIMNARMMPVDTLFKRFPRMIRDVSRQLGKPIHFTMSGQETELDRSVIEQIGDPLIHLLRNAADHGIEPMEERCRAKKNETGSIGLTAYHQENHIHIEVVDDGRGLDLDVLKRRAVEKGVLSPDEAERLSPAENAELIFTPGLTTAGNVSSLSGRGVGMDVVKKNIERVNGLVFVETEKGKGTKISIKLPLTLAILQALMVEIAGQVFAIPLSSVTEAVQTEANTVRRVKGWEMISVRHELTPLLNPALVWGEAWRVKERGSYSFPVVVLRSGSSPIGLKVDRLIGEEEIVVKTMGSLIGDIAGISGASILGDGRVALIVDSATLSRAMKQERFEYGGEGVWR